MRQIPLLLCFCFLVVSCSASISLTAGGKGVKAVEAGGSSGCSVLETITAVGDDADQALIAAQNEAAEKGGNAERRIGSEKKVGGKDIALYGVLAKKRVHLTVEVLKCG